MPRASQTYSLIVSLLTGAILAQGVLADPPPLKIEEMKPPAFAGKTFKWDKDGSAKSAFNTGYNGFDKSFATPNASSLFNKDALGDMKPITPPSVTMNKSFAARSYALPGNFTQFDKTADSIPLKSSAFASETAPGFNRNISMPAYKGPEADRVKKDMDEVNKTLANTKDLPDRSLSIEEVRALLNHNTKPEGNKSVLETLKESQPK